MKRTVFCLLSAIIILAGCSNSNASGESKNRFSEDFPNGGVPKGGFERSIQIIDDGSTTNYIDSTTAPATAVIAEDLYQNFTADGTVYISFNGSDISSSFEGNVTASDISIKSTSNSAEEESAGGLEIQYKGKLKLRYVLSGNFSGTVFIKNKNADAAVLLNGVNITSSKGSGPVLRFSSEKRTFIVAAPGTTNTLTDTRLLNQSSTMYDDKKGSVYSKGTLIFSGDKSMAGSSDGTLNIINSGYKHAVYSKDYVRIADGINLNITVEGETGRDCIRTLNAVIIDGGNINLLAKGSLEDDESNGIRVDGEDADDDDKTVEYSAGAGFVIINGGNITINTVAKGITAHWKSVKSVIGDSTYTATANNSLLCKTYLAGTSASTPDPFVEINGGTINITTMGEPYEGQTDDDPSCSPEGIEAKADFTINAGTLTVQTTDDAINAGGNFVMNGGALYACSSRNDAIDANGRDGITINGGVIVAIGLSQPECAFDCDNSPFTINGGLAVGLGTGMYTSPSKGQQSTGLLAASNCGDAETTMALVDDSGKPVFVYTLPAATGDIVILSSPAIKADTNYTVKTGVSVKKGSGVRFHNLYTTIPEIAGGTSTLTDFAVNSSNMIYTDSSAASGFRNFGGRGGFGGGPGRFGGPDGNFKNFDSQDRNFQPPEGFEAPEGFDKKQRGQRKSR